MRYGRFTADVEGREASRKSYFRRWGIVSALVFLLIAQSFAGLSFVTKYSLNSLWVSSPANTDNLRPYHQNRTSENSGALSAVPVDTSISDSSPIGSDEASRMIPLDVITRSNRTGTCPSSSLRWVHDTIRNNYNRSNLSMISSTDRRIPRILHMTSKTRCVTAKFATIIDKWRCKFDWTCVR